MANHVPNKFNFINKTQGYIAVVSTFLGKFRRTVLSRVIVVFPYNPLVLTPGHPLGTP